jgi:transcriptional regulator with XRE-family HTH domain
MARRSTASRLRARQQSARTGEEVRGARLNLGLTRQQVADRAGVSWATEAAIELGQPGVRLATLCAVTEAVGLDLVLRTYVGRQPSLRDIGQLEHAQLLVSVAHRLWKPELELSVGPRGEAIDLAFFGQSEILDCEIERMAGDFQSQYRRDDAKRLALGAQHQRPVRLVMAVEDTARNRVAVAPYEGLIRTALPAGSREVLSSLRSGEPLGRDGLLWLRPRRFRAPQAHFDEATTHDG